MEFVLDPEAVLSRLGDVSSKGDEIGLDSDASLLSHASISLLSKCLLGAKATFITDVTPLEK